MPKNKGIYLAILIIAASALLHLGRILTAYVAQILPWTTGLGIVLLVGAVFYEAQANKTLSADQDRKL